MLSSHGGLCDASYDVVSNSPAQPDKVIIDTDPGIGTVPPPLFRFAFSLNSMIHVYLRVECGLCSFCHWNRLNVFHLCALFRVVLFLQIAVCYVVYPLPGPFLDLWPLSSHFFFFFFCLGLGALVGFSYEWPGHMR